MDKLTRRELIAVSAAAVAASASSEAASTSGGRQQQNPPAHGWQYASAAIAAKAIQAKQISSVELTKLMLDRIQKLNPKINAIVVFDWERARKEKPLETVS